MKTNFNEVNSFCLSDLKNGMIIEKRNGDRRLVVDDYFIGWTGNVGRTTKSAYTESLESIYDKDLDIVKVYSISMNNITEVCDLIWERRTKKKMTKKEIEKILGYEIDILEEE